jgi:hypothetical protein
MLAGASRDSRRPMTSSASSVRSPWSPRRRWTRLGLVLALAARLAGAELPIRHIDVAQDGQTYTVNMVMFAPVPPRVAWDVLTDFDHMAGWLPHVRRSRVVAHVGSIVTVEQIGVAKVGLLGFPYASVRRIDLSVPMVIRAAQIEGSMRRVESTMSLAPEAAGTSLTYHLEIVPSLLAGRFISTRYIEREISEQFAAIVAEMVQRHHGAGDRPPQ